MALEWFKWGLEMFGKLFENLLPPEGADDSNMKRWRRSVAGSIAGMYAIQLLVAMLIAVHIAWICGLIPNVSGAAMADEVRSQINNIKADNALKLESIVSSLEFLEKQEMRNTLKSATRDACAAIEQNNQGALDQANATIDSLSDKYYHLFGRSYDRQPCDTLLIKAHT